MVLCETDRYQAIFYGGWEYSLLGAYKKILIRPQLVDDIERTAARFESPYGQIRSEWTRTGAGITLEVSIPVNTGAIVVLPVANEQQISEGDRALDVSGLRFARDVSAGQTLVYVGSGRYRFSVNL